MEFPCGFLCIQGFVYVIGVQRWIKKKEQEDPTIVPEGKKPLTRAQQYEIEFEDTSSEMLYEILAGSDYNDDAKRAAKNVLRKRKMPV